MRNKLVALLLMMILATSSILMVACSDEQELPDVETDDTVSTLADVPTDGSTIDMYDAKDNLYIAHGNLIASGSFVSTSVGQSVSMGVEQSISSTRTVIGNSVFKQTVSLSTFVKLAEQRYVCDGNYIVRQADSITSATDIEWQDSATKISQESFLELYGYTGTGLSGMILNDKSIISAELVSSGSGVYTYRYELDCDLAPLFLLSEMKTSSGSSSYPTFTSASLVISMDEDWNIISVTTDNSYTVKLGVSFSCTESIVETFSNIGSVDQLPEQEFFSQYMDAEIEDVVPSQSSTTDKLISIFGDSLFGQSLDLSFNASVAGSSVASGKISANIDIEDLDSLSVYASIDSLSAYGININDIDIIYSNNNIYLAHDDIKGSMSVDGALEAVSSVVALFGGSSVDIDIDVAQLLEDIIIVENSSSITASIVDLAGLGIDIVISASVSGDSYTLTDIVITTGDIVIELAPISSWDTPTISGSYPDMLTLLDIVDGGTISFDIVLPIEQLDIVIDASVSVDLTDGTVQLYSQDLLGASLSILLKEDTIYLSYGQVKLKSDIDDIASLLSVLSTYIPELSGSSFELDIDSIIDSIQLVGDGNTVNISVSVLGMQLGMVLGSSGGWTVDSIELDIDGIGTLVATPTSSFDIDMGDTGSYIPVDSVVVDIIESITDVIDSNGAYIKIDSATVAIGGNTYTISGTINISNGIEIDIKLRQGNVLVADVDVTIVDSIAYIDINDIKLALELDSVNSIDLDSLVGVNDNVDSIVLAIIDMVSNMPSLADIDMSTLISSVTLDNNTLVLDINLSQLSSALGSVVLSVNDKLDITLSGSFDNIDIAVTASVSEGRTVTYRDVDDYVTNIVLVIDQLNTVYGSIDIYNNIYRFVLDDLYLEINNRTFYISYGQLLCRGNVDEIEQYIDQLADIAAQYFGQDNLSSTELASIISLFNLDIDTILDSIVMTNNGLNMQLDVSVGCVNINVSIADGAIDIELPVGSKVLQLTTSSSSAEYFSFDSNLEYVSIEQLFADYMPLLEDIVTSNSWNFDITADISIDGVRYRVSGNLTLVYYSPDDYAISCDLVVGRLSGNSYTPYITVNFALVDGRVYISYSNQSNNSSSDNSLDLTVSLTALEACLDVFGSVLDVVPQLGELVDQLSSTVVQLSQQQDVNYSSILKYISYTDDVFRVVLDANMLVDNLADIDLSIYRSGDSINLLISNFVYNNFIIENATISVTAQDTQTGLDNIGSYDPDNYINLDSIEQLLSTFVVTADDTSFYISGTVDASVIGIVDITITIDLYVDILDTNGDGVDEVYIAAKIARPKLSVTEVVKTVAFDDYGGNSYLYYNGLTDSIRVVRDSYIYGYCSKCNSFDCTNFWHAVYRTNIELDSIDGDVSYDTGWMDSGLFADDIVSYLMDMLNFSSLVRDPIEDAVSGGSDTSYGIEDIISSYSYSNSTFGVSADLTPMDSNLGILYVNISHSSSDELQRLYGSTDMLSGLVDVSFDLYLCEPVPNTAYSYSNNCTWF